MASPRLGSGRLMAVAASSRHRMLRAPPTLKTPSQLKIWFNDLLEVTWVYEDDGGACHMRKKMKGLRFSSNSDHEKDTVSTHYRFQIGSYDCSIIFIISLLNEKSVDD